jgi:leucyl aminopeptidase
MIYNLTNEHIKDHILLFSKESFKESPLLSSEEKNWLSEKYQLGIRQACFRKNDTSLFVLILNGTEKDDRETKLEKARGLGHNAWKIVSEYKIGDITFNSEGVKGKYIHAFLEGFLLSTYKFAKYKKPDPNAHVFNGIFLKEEFLSDQLIESLRILVESVFIARDLVNEPVSTLNTQALAQKALEISEKAGVTVNILGETEIKALNMGGVLGVNKGSAAPPAFIVMEWKPKNAKNKKPLVLVGKGVAYDTGGYSIKTSGMESMKCDMGGAAVVIAGIHAAALNQTPLHIVGLVPVVENRVNEHAIVPGDILTMSDGTTVEVLNTDAEGRLILADALVYAKKYQPDLVLDFATLTGAAMRAIGSGGTVYMGTAGKEIKKIAEKCGKWTFERLVEFPLWEEYREQLKSEVADISNLGGPLGGACTAGKFLEHFTDYPWLHFDIAGPAFLSSPSSYRGIGGTGTGVRWLIDFYHKYQEEWLEEQKD